MRRLDLGASSRIITGAPLSVTLDGTRVVNSFTSTERGALVAGIALVLVGLALLLWPREGSVAHAVSDTEGTPAGVVVERVSKTGSQVYGVITVLFGVGLVSACLYGRRAAKS